MQSNNIDNKKIWLHWEKQDSKSKNKTKTVNKWPSLGVQNTLFIWFMHVPTIVFIFSQNDRKKRVTWNSMMVTRSSNKKKSGQNTVFASKHLWCPHYWLQRQHNAMKRKIHFMWFHRIRWVFIHTHIPHVWFLFYWHRQHVKKPRAEVFWQIYDKFRATACPFHYRITEHTMSTRFAFFFLLSFRFFLLSPFHFMVKWIGCNTKWCCISIHCLFLIM